MYSSLIKRFWKLLQLQNDYFLTRPDSAEYYLGQRQVIAESWLRQFWVIAERRGLVQRWVTAKQCLWKIAKHCLGQGWDLKNKTRNKWKLDNLVTLYLWTSCVLRNAQWLFSFLGVSTGTYYPSSCLNRQYLVLCGPRGIGTTFLATYSTWMDLGGFWTIKIGNILFFFFSWFSYEERMKALFSWQNVCVFQSQLPKIGCLQLANLISFMASQTSQVAECKLIGIINVSGAIFLLNRFDLGPIWTGENGFANFSFSRRYSINKFKKPGISTVDISWPHIHLC